MLDALASVLRDRLLADQPAPLPGLGTLQRQRVAARVEARPDGSRMLLPPSESLAFTPGEGAADDALAQALAERLDGPDPARALREVMDQVEGHLAASGRALLPGVGTLRRTGGGIAFDPDPTLLAAVGRPYEGLAPVHASAEPPASGIGTPPSVPFVDETTLDDDLDDVLDDVVAVPFDAADEGGLRALLPPTPPDRDPSTPTPPPVGAPSEPAPVTPEQNALDAAAIAASGLDPTPPSERTPTPVQMEEPTETDLGWLDAYDAPTTSATEGASIETPAVPVQAAPAEPVRHELPKPPPVIAGPVAPEPARRGAVWLWALLPLLALVALFFWFRSTQTTDPSPIAAATPPPTGETARLALDTALSDVEALPSATAALDTMAQDTTAAAQATAAGLDGTAPPDSLASSGAADPFSGEFAVEELGGSGGTASTPAVAPAAATTRPPAPTTPVRRSGIDIPVLGNISDDDRDALVSEDPIVAGRGGFSWVVLSTQEREPAERRARQYRDAGWRVRVFQTETQGQTVFRVALGQFETRAQADRLRPLLPSQVPTDTWRLDLSTL